MKCFEDLFLDEIVRHMNLILLHDTIMFKYHGMRCYVTSKDNYVNGTIMYMFKRSGDNEEKVFNGHPTIEKVEKILNYFLVKNVHQS